MATVATAQISFGIRGQNLQPEAISKLLGLEPTHSFTRGDSYSSSVGVRFRPFGVWQLRSDSKITSINIEDHANFILNQLEPHGDEIAALLADPTLYIDIRVWWEFPSETVGFSLSSAILRRLASLCKEFNFTFIASASEEENDEAAEISPPG